jgi:hypothetical protein
MDDRKQKMRRYLEGHVNNGAAPVGLHARQRRLGDHAGPATHPHAQHGHLHGHGTLPRPHASQPKVQDSFVPRPLFALASKYECGNHGPGTVSSGIIGHGKRDLGGPSYGICQFTSQDYDAKTKKIIANGGTVSRFLNSDEGRRWLPEFKDKQGKELDPRKGDFKKKWQEVARRDRQNFADAQQTFAEKTYFAPQRQLIKKETGIDVGTSGPLAATATSTAIQKGQNTRLTVNAIKQEAVRQKTLPRNLSQQDAIHAIYGARAKKDPSMSRRYAAEEIDAQKMVKAELKPDRITARIEPGSRGTNGPVPTDLSRTLQPPQADPVSAIVGHAVAGIAGQAMPVPKELARSLGDSPAGASSGQPSALRPNEKIGPSAQVGPQPGIKPKRQQVDLNPLIGKPDGMH